MTGPVARALAAILPAPSAPEAAFAPAFREAAELLLRRATLVAGGVPLRPVEIELYYWGGSHRDAFAHRHPTQERLGAWYFHRIGESYRGGSFKGLDLTIGRAGEACGGILLRAASFFDETRVEGPSLLVDAILDRTGSPSIAALADRLDPAAGADAPGAPLHLRLEPAARPLPVYASARVGLFLKRGDLASKARHLARPYRFLVEPARARTGRPQIVAGMHQEGRAAGEIAALTGVRLPLVRRYIDAFERGRGRAPGDYLGDLTPERLCELLGACAESG